jgi:hypothetical protein
MYGKKSCDVVRQKGTGNHVYQWEHFGYRYFLENVSNPLRHSTHKVRKHQQKRHDPGGRLVLGSRDRFYTG